VLNTRATLRDITWLSPNDSAISLPTGVNGTVEVLRLAAANEVQQNYSVRGIIRPRCRWEDNVKTDMTMWTGLI
jgi:hypothetical protein